MNRLILLTVLLAVPLAGVAADPQKRGPKLENISQKILNGEIKVGGKLSMDEKQGRYHEIHVDIIGLDCHTCHYGKKYQDDYLLLRKDETLRDRAKGQVTRETCIACHQEEGMATVFYKGRSGIK
jgi:hypothetical protein